MSSAVLVRPRRLTSFITSDHFRLLLMGPNSRHRAADLRVANTAALEVAQMGDFKYVSLLCWLFSLWCCGYEPRAWGILIKGLAPVLNSLLLERPAFISLAQQTTDTHRRLRVRTRLQSYTRFTFGECVFVCFRPSP